MGAETVVNWSGDEIAGTQLRVIRSEEAAKADESSFLRKAHNFTILLVDDIEENLICLEQLLQTENRTFIKASNGQEALKIASEQEIGLIMLDIQMPEMDGFEVARLLRLNPKTKDIAIIFVTAINKDDRFILQGFKEGAVDYLFKPLHVAITRAKVDVFEKLYLSQKELKDRIAEKEFVNKHLERFMYVVAHDLKSPLTSIRSLVSLLKSDERINSIKEVEQYLELLSETSAHSSEMIASLLDQSVQNQAQAEEETDVELLVNEVARLVFKPKPVEIVIDSKLPVLKTNRLKLQQVFQNLINNAVKFNDKPEIKINVGVKDKGKFWEFYVKDNGPGVAEEDRKIIFNLFETAKGGSKNENSTGIGLNIVKMYIEEQGGTISVNSVLGKGSNFFFDWKK
ncbi:sensor histidine kinase [Rubrolithibacter danxiaensis]|uniref:sensor histidine kinase n=1 Tax=Rubrolithibacter danxiaensis TaxID=3390805 RepID=UPI003BF79FCC